MKNKEFDLACSRVLTGEELSDGFTVYNERFIHKAVKLYLDPDVTHHERPLLRGIQGNARPPYDCLEASPMAG